MNRSSSFSGTGHGLALFALLALLPSAVFAQTLADGHLPKDSLAQMRRLAPEQTITVSLQEGGDASRQTVDSPWTLRRIDVYAPDAQLVAVGMRGAQPLSRSTLMHFLAHRDGERMALSLAPDGKSGSGLLLDAEGTWKIDLMDAGRALRWTRDVAEPESMGGHALTSDCLGGIDGPVTVSQNLALNLPAQPATPNVATRKVTVALDTDNELLLDKFSNDTTAASNYLAQLVVQMNVIYEKDPPAGGGSIQLQIGTQILRTTSDPYPSATGSDIVAQLNEFGAHWMANYAYSTYPRAFALMISGKSSNANSAQGIAWLLTSGSYCAATGQTFGGQTYGHYSISRVFKYSGATAANDAPLVAHELGHNFGLAHTHCTDTSGSQPAATNTLDQCFAGESSAGCYSGPTSCPSGSPGAPKGTLMSYCHVAGCGSPNAGLFHPVQVTVLNNRIASQPSSCVVPISANSQGPSINPLSPANNSTTALGGGAPGASVSGQISFQVSGGSGSGTTQLSCSVNGGSVSITGNASQTIAVGGSVQPVGVKFTLSGASQTGQIKCTATPQGASATTYTYNFTANAASQGPAITPQSPANNSTTALGGGVPGASVTGQISFQVSGGSGAGTTQLNCSVNSGSVIMTGNAGQTIAVGGSVQPVGVKFTLTGASQSGQIKCTATPQNASASNYTFNFTANAWTQGPTITPQSPINNSTTHLGGGTEGDSVQSLITFLINSGSGGGTTQLNCGVSSGTVTIVNNASQAIATNGPVQPVKVKFELTLAAQTGQVQCTATPQNASAATYTYNFTAAAGTPDLNQIFKDGFDG